MKLLDVIYDWLFPSPEEAEKRHQKRVDKINRSAEVEEAKARLRKARATAQPKPQRLTPSTRAGKERAVEESSLDWGPLR